MRISDWSSDVCSSDLDGQAPVAARALLSGADREAVEEDRRAGRGEGCLIPPLPQAGGEIIVCYRFTPHSTVPLPTLRTVQVGWPSTTVLPTRSEEHTSELQSLMRSSYAVFCLKKKKKDISIRSRPT